MLQPTDTITRILKQYPAAARVFERHGMEYCCSGVTTLADACAERGTDITEVIRDLEELLTPASEGPDPSILSATELVEHIKSTHHAYLGEEIPRLDAMTERVAMVHGGRNPRLQEVRDTWGEVALLVKAHMEKQERLLFPLIHETAPAAPRPESETANVLAELEKENGWVEEGIGRLRELTEDYIAPPWACGTYRAMLEALTRFEADTMLHLRKEETWLFPRIMNPEQAGAV